TDAVAARDAGGDDPRDGGVHVARAGAWQDRGQARGYLGVRMRALRDARGTPGVRGRRRAGDPVARAAARSGLGAVAAESATVDSEAAAPLPAEGCKAATTVSGRRADLSRTSVRRAGGGNRRLDPGERHARGVGGGCSPR